MPGAVLGAWLLRLPGHQWAGMFPWQVYFVLGMGEGEVGAGLQGCWVLEGSQLSVPRELEREGRGELSSSQAGQLWGTNGTPGFQCQPSRRLASCMPLGLVS